MIIDSPEMGEWVAANLDAGYEENAYEVVLNEDGKLRWIDRRGDEEIWLDKEPQTSWWRRFKRIKNRPRAASNPGLGVWTSAACFRI